jgi:hypothetical protein
MKRLFVMIKSEQIDLYPIWVESDDEVEGLKKFQMGDALCGRLMQDKSFNRFIKDMYASHNRKPLPESTELLIPADPDREWKLFQARIETANEGGEVQIVNVKPKGTLNLRQRPRRPVRSDAALAVSRHDPRDSRFFRVNGTQP